MCSIHWLNRLQSGPTKIAVPGGAVEVLCWSYHPDLPDNQPHRHAYFEVCQLGAYGEGYFIVDETPYPLHPGDVFFARPGTVHQIINTAQPRMELYWVAFQWFPERTGVESEGGALWRAFASSRIWVAPDENVRIASLWKALQTVCNGPYRPGFEAQLEGLIASFLLAIAQAGTDGSRPDAGWPDTSESGNTVAHMALRYIHDNLERPLSIAEIAHQVCVSPRHLGRLVTQLTGMSPVTYVTGARLARAGSLLLDTDRSIKEIAVSIGYADVHYFTRVFTQRFGCPPGAYRRRSQENNVRKVQKVA